MSFHSTRTRCVATAIAAVVFVQGARDVRADDPSMSSYVAEVLLRNPTLPAARLRRDAFAFEARGVTWSDPVVAVMVDNVPHAQGGLPAMVRYQLTQTIPWPGKIGFQQEAIEHQGEGAAADVDTRRIDLRLEAERAYYMLWLDAGRRTVNRSIRALVDTVAHAALGHYSAGGGNQHDVIRAQVETASLDVDFVNLEGERGSILALLNALRLQPSTAPMADPVDIIPPSTTVAIAAMTERALTNRPELRRVRAMQDESSAMAALARRKPYPDVMVSLWMNQMLAGMPPSGGAMIGFTIPVFGGPSGAARGAAFDDRAESAAESDTDLRSMIRAQVAATVIAVQTAQRVVDLLDGVVLPKAHESFDASVSAYGAGTVDMVSVLDAARALQKSELDLVEAKVRRGVAYAQLERAIGGPL